MLHSKFIASALLLMGGQAHAQTVLPNLVLRCTLHEPDHAPQLMVVTLEPWRNAVVANGDRYVDGRPSLLGGGDIDLAVITPTSVTFGEANPDLEMGWRYVIDRLTGSITGFVDREKSTGTCAPETKQPLF